MTAEDAKIGIRKIYNAQILTIIATLISIAGVVAMIGFGKVLSSNGDTVNNADVFSLIVIVASLVLAIVAFVLNIRGISLASKDEPSFRAAMVMVIMELCTSVLSVAFAKTKPSLSKAFESVNNVSELLATYYIIRGCIHLALQKKNLDIVKSATTAIKLVIIVWIIAIILQCAAIIFPSGDKATTVEGILSIASLVLALISYIIYLKVLRKTSEIL